MVFLRYQRLWSGCFLVFVFLLGIPAGSFGAMEYSSGQTIYLSVIPQIQGGPRGKQFDFAFLFVVRNTDPRNPATIRSITYHDAGGKKVQTIQETPLTLEPLASHAVHFGRKELTLPSGMSGCMIITWEAKEKISPVLTEGVVIGTGTGWSTGMVFKGVVVEERELPRQ